MVRGLRKIFGSNDSNGRKGSRFGFDLDALESLLDGDDRRRRHDHDDVPDASRRRHASSDDWNDDDDAWDRDSDRDRDRAGHYRRERRFEDAFDF
jgi:hypothetical protein